MKGVLATIRQGFVKRDRLSAAGCARHHVSGVRCTSCYGWLLIVFSSLFIKLVMYPYRFLPSRGFRKYASVTVYLHFLRISILAEVVSKLKL